MEFLLAVSVTSSKDPIRKAELFFSMYDIDRNGLIDGNEMRSVIEVCFFLNILILNINDCVKIIFSPFMN